MVGTFWPFVWIFHPRNYCMKLGNRYRPSRRLLSPYKLAAGCNPASWERQLLYTTSITGWYKATDNEVWIHWKLNSIKLLILSAQITMTHAVKLDKLSLYSPEQALRIPGGCSKNVWTISTYRVQVFQHYAPATFTPHDIPLGLICVRGWVDPRALVRPEELSRWKIPMTPSGIEPATFQLVAQCFHQMRHRAPQAWSKENGKVPFRAMKPCGVEAQLYSFLTLAVDWGAQFHTLNTSPPRKQSPAPTENEAECVPELVWTIWRRDTPPAQGKSQTKNPQTSSQ